MSDALTNHTFTLETVIQAIDELLDPIRCKTPGNPAPGIEHCAACCYGTGWVLTCEEDEAYLDSLLAARKALADFLQGAANHE